jgi:hypothetical protein
LQFALRLGYNLRARSTEFWARFVLPVVFVSLVLAVAMAFGVQQLQACVASQSKWGACLKDLTGIQADDPKANTACNQTTLNAVSAALLHLNATGLPNWSAVTITTCANATAAGSSAAAKQLAVCCNAGAKGRVHFAFYECISAWELHFWQIERQSYPTTLPTRDTQADWLSALVVVVGSLLLFAVGWAKLEAVVKPLSDSIMDKLKYVSMPDHSGKIGYQHAVSCRCREPEGRLALRCIVPEHGAGVGRLPGRVSHRHAPFPYPL